MVGEIIKAEKVLKIGQRIEFEAGEGHKWYTSRIEDISSDRLAVAMPMDEKRRPVIPIQGTKTYCRVIGDHCMYRFFAVYEDKAAIPIPVWYIRKPDVVERWQRRQFVRVRTSLAIQVQIIHDEGQMDSSVETTTIDISGNGLCFVYQESVCVGSKVAIEIRGLPDIGNVQIMTTAVKCISLEVPAGRIYHVGVQFDNLTRTIQTKLVHFIFDLQRKNLMKSIE